MQGHIDAPDEVISLWTKLANSEDEEALIWLSNALHDNTVVSNYQTE